MKTNNYYILLLLIFFTPTATYGMIRKIEDAMYNVYNKIDETFKVKDEVLFESKKPIEIIQFPKHSDSVFKQTHEIAKSLIPKLSKHGFSFDNVKTSKLYFINPTDAIQAIKILKETYPTLANKTTLHQWDDEMPDPKYKIFIEIKASANKKNKKANL